MTERNQIERHNKQDILILFKHIFTTTEAWPKTKERNPVFNITPTLTILLGGMVVPPRRTGDVGTAQASI